MPYVLGVDLGTSRTTAAVCRADEGATVLPLDDGARSVHSVLYLAANDTVLVGRDALARADAEPDRMARGFCARIGDPVAPLVGGRPCPAEMLMAALVSWVVDRAVDTEGTDPGRIVLTHPVTWGTHRRLLLDHALRQAGLPDVLLLPKPVAVAENHLAAHPMEPGDAIATYHLGGHTLSCAVTRLGPSGFELLSRAEVTEAVGGTHFDDVLATDILTELNHAPADLDPFDEDLRAAMAEFRAAVRTAKKTLSTATEAVVPTPLLGPPSSVLIGRARFEELIGPAVYRSVDALAQAVRSAGVPTQGLGAALAGGSAGVPLIAELVAATLSGAVTVDGDPQTALARGAALAGRRTGTPKPKPKPVDLPAPRAGLDAPTQPPRPPVQVAPLEPPRRGAKRWNVVSRARRRAD